MIENMVRIARQKIQEQNWLKNPHEILKFGTQQRLRDNKTISQGIRNLNSDSVDISEPVSCPAAAI
jgi:hypothetical protein